MNDFMRSICISLLTILYIFGLSAQTSDYIALRMEVSEMDGDTIRATMVADQFINMIAFEFNIIWDTDDIEFLNLAYTNTHIELFPDFFNLDNTANGTIRIIWTNPACESLVSGDSLFSFLYRKNTADFVIEPAQEQMNFYDCEGNELDLEYTDNQGTTKQFPVGGSSSNADMVGGGVIKIFPNPIENYFTLQFSERKSGTIKVYDSTGKIIVMSEIFETAIEVIDASSWDRGWYLLEWMHQDKRLLFPILRH